MFDLLYSSNSETQTKPHVFSPDQLKTWSRCQKKFELQYVNQLQWPSDKRNFSLGQDVHKLMEFQALGLDASTVLRHASADVQHCWQQLIEHPITNLPIIASEWAFWLPFKINGEKVWLTGRIDRIAYDSGKQKLMIIDWKTGTAAPKLPESDWQTLIYRYAILEAYSILRDESGKKNSTSLIKLPEQIEPEQIEMVYLEVPRKAEQHIREIFISNSENQHQQTKMIIEKNLSAILQAEQYPLPAQCPDHFCGFSAICGIKNNSIKQVL